MNYIDTASYWETHAGAWVSAFGKKRQTMHPAIQDGTSKSALRPLFFAEELVCSYIQNVSASRVFDCGSGVSASMLYMSNIYPDTIFSGICASEAEIDFSRNSIREADKIKSVRAFKGDFEDSTNYRVFPIQNVVYCIDSLRFSRSPNSVFRIFHEKQETGGIFIVCDYFLSELKLGFRTHSLGPVSALRNEREVIAAASDAGYELLDINDWSKNSLRTFLQSLFIIPATIFAFFFDRKMSHVLTFRNAMEWGIRRGTVVYRAIVFKKK